MFDSYNGNFDIKQENINGKGVYVVTAGLTNNGILGKTDVEARVFKQKSLTVDMFGFAFFRPFKYKMVTHARVFSLIPKFDITDRQGLFLANSLHYLHKKYGYENMCSWVKIKDNKIQLPIKNGEIDFDFMESFIAELETQRIAELEAYLSVTGLKNYELTEDEQKALKSLDEVEWKEYKLDDLFFVLSSKKRYDANKVTINTSGKYPYVVRMSNNNGHKGYLDEDCENLNDANTISFGQDTATVFYQEKPYFTGDKIKVLKSKNELLNKTNAQFFIATITKSFSSFSWGSSSYSEKVIKNQTIKLPNKNNQIDFDFMCSFISAVQKLVIKDVVLYADEKITDTKAVVYNK